MNYSTAQTVGEHADAAIYIFDVLLLNLVTNRKNKDPVKDELLLLLLYRNEGHTEISFITLSVTVSVLSIEGTDCRLDELGRLADRTGGKVSDSVRLCCL